MGNLSGNMLTIILDIYHIMGYYGNLWGNLSGNMLTILDTHLWEIQACWDHNWDHICVL